MKSPTPNWWWLYAVLPWSAALLVAADILAPSAGWRMVAEGAADTRHIGERIHPETGGVVSNAT